MQDFDKDEKLVVRDLKYYCKTCNRNVADLKEHIKTIEHLTASSRKLRQSFMATRGVRYHKRP